MKSPEKRKQKRRHVANAVEYALASSTPGEFLDGVVANINKTGLCLLTTNRLKKGQIIIIKNGNRASTMKEAIVRWSEKYLGLYYKSGVEFIQ